MKYLVSSTVATLCFVGATGVYYAADEVELEAPPIESVNDVEEKITQKMTSVDDPGVFLPYMECELVVDGDLNDEKIQNHITECMKNTHSWQPVESYAN